MSKFQTASVFVGISDGLLKDAEAPVAEIVWRDVETRFRGLFENAPTTGGPAPGPKYFYGTLPDTPGFNPVGWSPERKYFKFDIPVDVERTGDSEYAEELFDFFKPRIVAFINEEAERARQDD